MAVVEVSELRKRYGGHTVLDGVSFTVEDGEIFGVIGHNGAGKTTAVESVVGLRVPDGGAIRVLGVDPLREREVVRRSVGVQLQDARLPDRIRVVEALRLFASFYPSPRDIDDLLSALGLGEHATTFFRDLSGGLKQRVSLALALVGTPRVAVLDELTTGLDPHARRDVWQLVEDVRAGGVTVLLVTHSMEEAERLCDRVLVLHGSRVVACDTPAALVDRAGGGHHVSFRAATPLPELRALPTVRDVRRDGDRIVVTGQGETVAEVLALLSREGLAPERLRVAEPTLDDAFLALTGRPPAEERA